jgi:hypothetical protein
MTMITESPWSTRPTTLRPRRPTWPSGSPRTRACCPTPSTTTQGRGSDRPHRPRCSRRILVGPRCPGSPILASSGCYRAHRDSPPHLIGRHCCQNSGYCAPHQSIAFGEIAVLGTSSVRQGLSRQAAIGASRSLLHVVLKLTLAVPRSRPSNAVDAMTVDSI